MVVRTLVASAARCTVGVIRNTALVRQIVDDRGVRTARPLLQQVGLRESDDALEPVVPRTVSDAVFRVDGPIVRAPFRRAQECAPGLLTRQISSAPSSPVCLPNRRSPPKPIGLFESSFIAPTLVRKKLNFWVGVAEFEPAEPAPPLPAAALPAAPPLPPPLLPARPLPAAPPLPLDRLSPADPAEFPELDPLCPVADVPAALPADPA
jgi:hypothetical protein